MSDLFNENTFILRILLLFGYQNMSSTIKVDKKLKSEIDRIQAKLTIKTGEKITQQDLLRKIIEYITIHEENFLGDFEAEWNPPSEEEWLEIKSIIKDFGFKTSERTIDNELYGN